MTEEIIRKHTSLTYPIEKKILDQLASKIYKYFTADSLSFLGLVGAILIGISYYLGGENLSYLLIALLGIFINWFGDSLDGRVAYLRNEGRPKRGHYLDHFIDDLSFMAIGLGIHFSKLTIQPIWLYVLIFVMLTSVHVYLKTSVTKLFDLDMGLFGGTERRIIFIFLTLIVLVLNNPLYYQKTVQYYTFLDLTGIITLVLVIIFLAINVFRTLWGKDKIKEASITK